MSVGDNISLITRKSLCAGQTL